MRLSRWHRFIAVGVMLVVGSCSDGDVASRPEGATDAQAIVLESPDGLARITVTGSTDELGRYLALGEVQLAPGQEEGVVVEGAGVAVVQAENGDQLVADVASKATSTGFDFTFHWRDSVTFSTGSTLTNSGAFVDQRPPGLLLSRIRGRMFNDTSVRCITCFVSRCGDTSCTARCETTCSSVNEPLPIGCNQFACL